MVKYTKKNFKIYTAKDGHIIHNTKYKFQEAHTHRIKSFDMAKTILDNVLYKRKPHTKNQYLLRSHKKLTKDKKYIRLINHLMNKAKDKQDFYNHTGARGVRR